MIVRTLHVIVPVYNERGTLAECLNRVLRAELPEGWSKSLVVVDDCSEPTSAAAAQNTLDALRARGVDVTLLRHTVNQGKGAALRTGFDHVLNGKGDASDLIIIQDADLEYNPNDYAALMAPLLDGSADAVIGTRWGSHRSVKGIKRKVHAFGNGALTVASNVMTGYRLHDMECCYKVLSVQWMRQLRPMLTESRFGVEPQLVASLSKLRARVTEVAVWYDPRGLAEGKKIGWRDGVRALWVITRERFRKSPSRNEPAAGIKRAVHPAAGRSTHGG